MIAETLRLMKLIVHRIVGEELQIRKMCDKLVSMHLQIVLVPDKTLRRNDAPIDVQPQSIIPGIFYSLG